MSVNLLECFGDSNLITSQVSGTYDVVDPNMIVYLRAVD
jgi:hypothetical protein